MKTAILMRTGNLSTAFFDLVENLNHHGHTDAEVVLVADRRTPIELPKQLAKLPSPGVHCRVLSIEEQRDYAGDALWRGTPFDSNSRIALGLTAAYRSGAEFALMLDPQARFRADVDFLTIYLQAMQLPAPAVHAEGGWLNLADCLQLEGEAKSISRGFPFLEEIERGRLHFSSEKVPVLAHLGLRRGVLDADAAVLLESNPRVLDLQPGMPLRFTLGQGTWTGLASNSLFLRREAIPGYCISAAAGNYGDIWAGYVLLRIGQHLGKTVSVGAPLAECDQPPENLRRLYEFELAGYRLSLPLCSALRALPLMGTTVHDCFGEIAARLGEFWLEPPKASAVEIEARKQFLASLKCWHAAFAEWLAGDAGRLHERVNAAAGEAVKVAVGQIT